MTSRKAPIAVKWLAASRSRRAKSVSPATTSSPWSKTSANVFCPWSCRTLLFIVSSKSLLAHAVEERATRMRIVAKRRLELAQQLAVGERHEPRARGWRRDDRGPRRLRPRSAGRRRDDGG